MGEKTRKAGVDVIGEVPWGTHLCLFYQTKEDLVDILVPYFRAGLENNEFCMWVTSEPLGVEDATRALQHAVKDLDDYREKGQIEILDHSQWYTRSGMFEADKVLQGWVAKEDRAVRKGFDGLRLSGNTFWLERRDWEAFTGYEAAVNGVIGGHRMLGICTYSLEKCGAAEVMDVVSNHRAALIRRAGEWEMIESATRKQAEEALRESEERYRTLFESMLEGFAYCKMLYDDHSRPVDWVYLDVNRAFERLTGLKNIVGKRVTEAIPGIKESNPELFEIYGRVALTGQPERFEVTLESLSLCLNISVFSPAKGHFVAVFEDITERKQVAATLAAERNLLRTLIDNMPDLIYVKDVQSRFIVANEATARLMGAGTSDDLLNKTDFDFYPQALAAKFYADERRIIESGQPLINLEEPGLDSCSRQRWLSTTKVPLRDGAGNVVGLVGIGRDITERKQGEAEKERLQAQLLQSHKMEAVGQLAGGLAHDFNNLLTAIIGFADLLQMGMSPGDSRLEMLASIQRSGERAAYLVSQLLAFASKQMVAPQPLNLNHVLATMDGTLRRTLGQGIDLIARYQPDLWLVEMDPDQFKQVVNELAMHARDAMPRGGKLMLETANVTLGPDEAKTCPEVLPGDYVLLTVSDTGAGMSGEAVARIFEPFFITSRAVADGKGLRLAAVYGAVKQNKGHVYVESQEGRGTAFKAYLPRYEQRQGGSQVD